MTVIEDIFRTTKTYLESQLLSANLVTLGYVDERADPSDDTSLPQVTINLYDCGIDSQRRVGGRIYDTVDLDPGGTGDLEFHPLKIPMNYYFQVDTLAEKYKEAWALNEVMEIIMGRKWTKLTLASGDKVYIIPQGAVPLTGLEGLAIHRTTYSYYIQAWLTDPTPPIVVNKVLTLNISYEERLETNIIVD